MAMQFKNPANGYIEDVSNAPLWSLLFGFFYFAARGVWTHAAAGAALAFITCGLSWIIYPFFAKQIMRTHYLRRGWIDVSAVPPTSTASPPPASRDYVAQQQPDRPVRNDERRTGLTMEKKLGFWDKEVPAPLVALVLAAFVAVPLVLFNAGRPADRPVEAREPVTAQAPNAERERCRPKTAEERWAYLELKKRLAEGTLTTSERVAAKIAVGNFEIELIGC